MTYLSLCDTQSPNRRSSRSIKELEYHHSPNADTNAVIAASFLIQRYGGRLILLHKTTIGPRDVIENTIRFCVCQKKWCGSLFFLSFWFLACLIFNFDVLALSKFWCDFQYPIS